jgi:hypothetical protein
MSTKVPQNALALRAAMVRRAMDLLGTRAYAARMDAAERTVQAWAAKGGDPNRPVTDAILRKTLAALVDHRQDVARLGQGIRAALGEQGERE